MIIKVLILFFISHNLFSQNKDTIYIFFNHLSNKEYYSVSNKNSITVSESYLLMDKNKFKYLYFSTGFDGYLSFKDKEQNKKAATKWLSKKFIKENKDVIFTYKEIEEMGFQNMINKIDKYVVLLIDKKIRKNRKYKAREVNILYEAEL